MKKEQILKLCNLFNERHKKYNSYITQLPNDLSQIQFKIIEFVKTILYELLSGISYTEKNNLSDKKINRAFKICFQSCIDRISIAIQGTNYHCFCFSILHEIVKIYVAIIKNSVNKVLEINMYK